MKKLTEGPVYLDTREFSREYLRERFGGIYEECLNRGLHMERDLLPVAPAQHYYMGGIEVDRWGRSSMEGLYAVGEASCTGLHGKNRLARNSLLEALVYSGRAAERLNGDRDPGVYPGKPEVPSGWDYREVVREMIIEERGDLEDELLIS